MDGLGNIGLCVVRVYLRGPLAAGTQHGDSVVVYREMTIIEEYFEKGGSYGRVLR
jgi:hypothetical protein